MKSYQYRLQNDITWTTDKGGEWDIIYLLIRCINRQSMTSEGFVPNLLSLNLIRPLENTEKKGQGNRHQQEAVRQMETPNTNRTADLSVFNKSMAKCGGGAKEYSRWKELTESNVWASFGSSFKQTNYKTTFQKTI